MCLTLRTSFESLKKAQDQLTVLLLDSAASKDELLHSGVTVASLFFGKVFGHTAQKALTVFVALR